MPGERQMDTLGMQRKSKRGLEFSLPIDAGHSYVNFAHGDEDLEVVYGDSLPKLRELKKRMDPNNIFDQWFNIK